MKHSIVVMSKSRKALKRAHKKAKTVFQYVSPIITTDDSASFFVPTYSCLDSFLCAYNFIIWLEEHRYKNGNVMLHYATVSYKDAEFERSDMLSDVARDILERIETGHVQSVEYECGDGYCRVVIEWSQPYKLMGEREARGRAS